MPQFVSRAEKIVAGIEADEWDGDPTQRPEIDELIDACDVMVEAIADVRQALLLNRHSDDVDSDNEYEEGLLFMFLYEIMFLVVLKELKALLAF